MVPNRMLERFSGRASEVSTGWEVSIAASATRESTISRNSSYSSRITPIDISSRSTPASASRPAQSQSLSSCRPRPS